MGARHIGRLISTIALSGAIALVAASCGSAASDTSNKGDASTFDGSLGNTFSSDSGGGGNACTPTTCAAQGFDCGVNSDGCGGTIDCGTCSGGNLCGVGGFSKCGNPF